MKNPLIKISAMAAIAFALSACGNSNSSNVSLVGSDGKHSADWIKTHKNVAVTSSTACTECHGNDLSGGISRVSCISPTTGCHTSSPVVNPTGCVSCHVQGTAPGVPQDNSFYSGTISFSADTSQVNLHRLHIALSTAKPACASCHNLDKLETRHFTSLTPPAFEAAAASTIGGGNTQITNYTPFDANVPSGNCTTSCHANRFWIN